MALIINEGKMIEDNIFLYEERLKTPLRRFIDKTPTPVRYWHIRPSSTNVDIGFQDVEEFIGSKSPIKFDRIEKMPLYGMEMFTPQMENGEFGLNINYEAEAVIMSDTIEPYANDFFILYNIKQPCLFRVTSVEFDSMLDGGCYKIGYSLESIDKDIIDALEYQTSREYVCLMENIGTQEKCILEVGLHDRINAVYEMYDSIVDSYLTFFYNSQYNCLLANTGDGKKIFDPMLLEFIIRHNVFKRKNQLDSLFMTEQFSDPRRQIKYHKSLYRFIETRRKELLNTFPYTTFMGMSNRETAFYRWLDRDVEILDINLSKLDCCGSRNLMDVEFAELIKINGKADTIYGQLIIDYINKEDISVFDIDLDLGDELLLLENDNLEVYFYTPIILYILKRIILNDMVKERKL